MFCIDHQGNVIDHVRDERLNEGSTVCRTIGGSLQRSLTGQATCARCAVRRPTQMPMRATRPRPHCPDTTDTLPPVEFFCVELSGWSAERVRTRRLSTNTSNARSGNGTSGGGVRVAGRWGPLYLAFIDICVAIFTALLNHNRSVESMMGERRFAR